MNNNLEQAQELDRRDTLSGFREPVLHSQKS